MDNMEDIKEHSCIGGHYFILITAFADGSIRKTLIKVYIVSDHWCHSQAADLI